MRQIDVEWRVETPEHVAFAFRPAGPLPRLMAWLIDGAIRVAILMVVGLVAGIGEVAVPVLLLGYFVLEWFYGAWFESRPKGRTPGKAAFGLRVIRQDGMPAGFGACFLRNALRAADSVLEGFAIGLLTMGLSGGFRRLGDLAAGTLVVYDDRHMVARSAGTATDEIDAMTRLLPEALVQEVDGSMARTLGDFVAKRQSLSLPRKREIASHLAEPLARRFELPADLDPDKVLCALHRVVFHGRPTGEATEPHAGLSRRGSRGGTMRRPELADRFKERRKAWIALETAVGVGDGKLTGEQASRFAHDYRAACADLALATSEPLAHAAREYLQNLVGRAYMRFYGQARRRSGSIVETLTVRGPAALFGDPTVWLGLGLFYGSFVLAAFIVARQPDAAATVIGQSMLDQLAEMHGRAKENRDAATNSTMFAFYIQHNVGIALSCFATGIFLGLGSVVTLLFNGVILGTVFGWMWAADDPLRSNFFEFVTAHGPFELTGIACAGAAGMRLGFGLVDGRGLPRLESLARGAKGALPMLIASAAMVALAAPVEGFISPSAMPLWGKRLIAAASLAAIVAYVGILGPRGRRQISTEGDR